MTMARLRHVSSGAVVSVPDEKAARLGSEWQIVAPDPPKAPAKKAAPKKSE